MTGRSEERRYCPERLPITVIGIAVVAIGPAMRSMGWGMADPEMKT